MREFVASAATIQTNNHTIRILAGTSAPGLLDDSMSCISDERYLQMALDNVSQRFCFVSFTEYFDESVRALFEVMAWPAIKKPPGKHNARRNDATALDDTTLQNIQESNALDLALVSALDRNNSMAGKVLQPGQSHFIWV